MMQDFKNMKNKSPLKKQAYVCNSNHSCMTPKDRIIPERLTADKIVANFEHFTSREKFTQMPDWLKKLFYSGGAKIINDALEKELSHDT